MPSPINEDVLEHLEELTHVLKTYQLVHSICSGRFAQALNDAPWGCEFKNVRWQEGKRNKDGLEFISVC
jgi:hypothetical protein